MKIFLLFLFAGSALSLTLTPSHNQWVRTGQETRLLCRSSEPISTCTWVTPYNSSYTLSRGLQTEGGRLKHFADADTDCGLIVANVTDEDSGVWTCSIGVVDNFELTSYTGRSTISIAKKPTSITLGEPFDTAAVNITLDEKSVGCMVSNGYPRPVFSWYIGEEELVRNSATEDFDNKTIWIQTIKYRPLASHANQTLRCVVDHVGLDETDEKEAGVVITFTDASEDFPDSADAELPIFGSSFNVLNIVMYFVIGFFVVLAACIVAVKTFRFWRSKRALAEAAVVADDDDQKPDMAGDAMDGELKEEEKKQDLEEKEEEAAEKKVVPRVAIRDRFASFFTFRRDAVEAVTEEGEKVKDVEFVALDIDDKVDSAESAQAVVGEEKKSSKIGAFLKFFRFRNDAKKADDEMGMEECKDDEEKQKMDAEEKEKVEFEPEEKEELKIEEEAKEAPKNTDV